MSHPSWMLAVLLLGTAGAQTELRAQSAELRPSPPGAPEFLEWARRKARPVTASPSLEGIAPLGEMVGDAHVVGFTEATHLAAEPLDLRNRLFEYLVEHKRFTAIAIESGIVESRTVNEYVRGGSRELSQTLAEGISWTFDRLPQNRALVRWMREYNADARHPRKLSFYGFDVPGSPGNPAARRGLDTAILETLAWLGKMDVAAAVGFRERLELLMPDIGFNPVGSSDTPGYHRLSAAQRDELTAAVADMVALLERNEARFVRASSAEDFEWAHRAAIGARQADHWLRQIPLGWKPNAQLEFPSERTRFYSAAADVRDQAQADNIEWILEREGPGARVLVFAHLYHLSAAPVTTRYWLPQGADHHLQWPAGTYLRERLGERFFVIGNLAGAGSVGCEGLVQTMPPTGPQSIERVAGKVGLSRFVLDLRDAPDTIRHWLDTKRLLGPESQALKVPPRQAFDALLYLGTVSPACPASQSQ